MSRSWTPGSDRNAPGLGISHSVIEGHQAADDGLIKLTFSAYNRRVREHANRGVETSLLVAERPAVSPTGAGLDGLRVDDLLPGLEQVGHLPSVTSGTTSMWAGRIIFVRHSRHAASPLTASTLGARILAGSDAELCCRRASVDINRNTARSLLTLERTGGRPRAIPLVTVSRQGIRKRAAWARPTC